MAEATTDGDALFAAIVATPDCDTTRLVYADWLDENGHHDRAELIRHQIASITGLFSERHRAREKELLRLHPDWRPACPSCGGHGKVEGLHLRNVTCHDCHGYGRVGTLARGFLESVEVPTLSSVLERVRVYDGDLYLPTPWARALIDQFPTVRRVRVGDREPIQVEGGPEFGKWFFPWRDLPEPIVSEMRKTASREYDCPFTRAFDTHEAAVDALALAVCRVLHRLCGGRDR